MGLDLEIESEPFDNAQLDDPTEDVYKLNVPRGCAGIWFYMRLASWWLAYNVLGALVSIVWPAQILAVVGPEKANLYNGFIPATGALVSLITTPLAGALSDRAHNRFGRRKIFILVGSIGTLATVLSLGPFHEGQPFYYVWILMILTMFYQLFSSIAAGPYAGLMPDLVKQPQFGVASGWLGFGITSGLLIGTLGTGFLVVLTNFWPAYTFLAAVFVFFNIPTLAGITEVQRPKLEQPFRLGEFVKQFYLDRKKYRNFYWVIFARLAEGMGVYATLPYYQYYLADVVGVEPTKVPLYTSIMICIIVVSSMCSSLIAGVASDRLGRKTVTYFATLVMALSSAIFTGICWRPSLAAAWGVAVFIGLGYGSYQTVDWALALDTLPPDAKIAKDMGIWHVAFVLPQVISPVITGSILTGLSLKGVYIAYSVVFAVTTFWFLLAAALIYPIVLPERPAAPKKQKANIFPVGCWWKHNSKNLAGSKSYTHNWQYMCGRRGEKVALS